MVHSASLAINVPFRSLYKFSAPYTKYSSAWIAPRMPRSWGMHSPSPCIVDRRGVHRPHHQSILLSSSTLVTVFGSAETFSSSDSVSSMSISRLRIVSYKPKKACCPPPCVVSGDEKQGGSNTLLQQPFGLVGALGVILDHRLGPAIPCPIGMSGRVRSSLAEGSMASRRFSCVLILSGSSKRDSQPEG